MEFNVNNIGKLAIRNYSNKPRTPFSRAPIFEFIVAYDYLAEKYLTVDLSVWVHAYSQVNPKSPLYTLEEALQCLDEHKAMMEQEKEKLIQRAFFYDQVRKNLQQTSKVNYQNEMLHLSNAYHEALRQKRDLTMYLSGTNSEGYVKMYTQELRRTEKALRRLDKRFNFYFGDNAEYVKECIREIGPYNTMQSGIKVLNDNMKRVDQQKESLVRKATKLDKITRKEENP